MSERMRMELGQGWHAVGLYLFHSWSQTPPGGYTVHNLLLCELGPELHSGHQAAAHPAVRSSSGWLQWRRCLYSAMPQEQRHLQVGLSAS